MACIDRGCLIGYTLFANAMVKNKYFPLCQNQNYQNHMIHFDFLLIGLHEVSDFLCIFRTERVNSIVMCKIILHLWHMVHVYDFDHC